MNWRLEKACSLDVDHQLDPNAIVVDVRLNADCLDRVCLGLCLLREDLIDRLDLVDANRTNLLTLGRSDRASSSEILPNRVDLRLDKIGFELVLYSSLRAVRDGVAEGHLDMEIRNEGQRNVDVTITYPSSPPPMSPEEARRRLGL